MNTYTLERNGVKETTVQKQIKRGADADSPYLSFKAMEDRTPKEIQNYLTFLGDVGLKFIENGVNMVCQNIMDAHATREPEFIDGKTGKKVPGQIISVDWEAVAKDLEDLKTASQTLDDLTERRMSLLETVRDLSMKAFGPGASTDDQKAAFAQAKVAGDEIAVIDQAIANRRAEFAARQEQKKKTEAAKEAAAKLVKTNKEEEEA